MAITQSTLDEIANYMRIFDVSLDREPHDPYIVPERMMLSFTSSAGHTFREIMNSNISKHIEKVNYLQFIQDTKAKNKQTQRLPPMHNNMCIYLYHQHVKDKSTSRASLPIIDKPLLIRIPKDQVNDQVKRLKSIFNECFPHYYFEMTPYGSMVQGLGFTSSSNQNKLLNINIEMDSPDMKRLIHREKNPYTSDVDEPHALSALRSILVRESTDKLDFKQDLCSFRLKANSMTVEFNFNKKMYTQSTYLIQKYISLDPRILPFISSIKYFVRGRNIIAPYLLSGGMRSYGYVIMALAYLQQVEPPVIPNLQHLFDTNTKDHCNVDHCVSKQPFWDTVYIDNGEKGIAARYHDCVGYSHSEQKTRYYARLSASTGTPYWRSSNENSVSELLIDFMHYYAYEFDYKEDAISLRTGGFAPRKQEFRRHEIVVEDPFISGQSISSSDCSLNKMIPIFIGAFDMLFKGQTLDQVLRTPDLGSNERAKARYASTYVPFKRLQYMFTAKTIVVIGLPNIPEAERDTRCLCEPLVEFFTTYGSVRDVQILDFTTCQLTIVNNQFRSQNITLPSEIEFQRKRVFIVELYEY